MLVAMLIHDRQMLARINYNISIEARNEYYHKSVRISNNHTIEQTTSRDTQVPYMNELLA